MKRAKSTSSTERAALDDRVNARDASTVLGEYKTSHRVYAGMNYGQLTQAFVGANEWKQGCDLDYLLHVDRKWRKIGSSV